MNLLGGAGIVMTANLLSLAVLAPHSMEDRLKSHGIYGQAVERRDGAYILSISGSSHGKAHGGWESDDRNEDGEDGPTTTATSNGGDLWVVDENSDKMFQYSEDGTILRTFSLTNANRDSKGIATDGTSFWVLDKKDKRVYRYNMSGQFQDSFDLTTPSNHLEGITTDGNGIWVVDEDSGVFRYSLSGVFQHDSFSLDVENSHAEGITTDGNSLWVVDKDVDKVFRYSLGGSLLDSFGVAPATHPEGITTDGASIWVVDKDTDKIYRFDMAGTLLGSFGLELPGNGKAGGLTSTATPALCGDLNGDGDVNVFDAIIVLQIIVGLIEPTLDQLVLSDLNRDGTTNLFDVILLLQDVVGLTEITDCGPPVP